MTDGPPLHPSLAPLSWLLGTWTGQGVGGYAAGEGYGGVSSFRFAHEVVVTHAGTPALSWRTRSQLLDDDGRVVRPGASEQGWWRRPPGAADPEDGMTSADPEDDMTSGGPDVELLLAHPTGHVEVWLGRTEGQRVELATDLVAGTATAKPVQAGRRLYGLVEGRLLWAYDMAAMGQPLQPHLSATLDRVPGTGS